MNIYSLIEIFTMIFVTMGPIKVVVTFAEKSAGLDSALRRRIAIKAVGARSSRPSASVHLIRRP